MDTITIMASTTAAQRLAIIEIANTQTYTDQIKKKDVARVGIRINGERRAIMCAQGEYAIVASFGGQYRAEYAWSTVARIVSTHGRFTF